MVVRANTNNYKPENGETGVSEISFSLVTNGQPTWFGHPDDRVDLAVIPVDSKVAEMMLLHDEIKIVGLNDFGTKEEIDKFKIGIGDGIISAGLVPNLIDARRNYPAFKFGKVSNVFDEPMKMRCQQDTPLKDRLTWLVAGNFVPGNSGSPVYLLPVEFTVGPPLEYDGPRPMLLGVLSGTIDGADLGMMVPVEFVFEIIQQHYPDGNLYRGAEKNEPPAARTPR